MKRLILASASPRRRELLARLGLEFEVRPVAVDETPQRGEDAEALALRLARAKALAGVQERSAERILGADTVVAREASILGKPVNAAEAREMLETLSGAEHQVVTGLALAEGDVIAEACAVSRVWFRMLTSEEIARYAAGGEPLDAAGGYAIQGGAARFISRVVGSYTNVVGLPLSEVVRLLRDREHGT
jgi:septum formation protein